MEFARNQVCAALIFENLLIYFSANNGVRNFLSKQHLFNSILHLKVKDYILNGISKANYNSWQVENVVNDSAKSTCLQVFQMFAKPTHKFTTLKLLKHIKDFFKITYFLPILNCDYKQPNNLMTCYLK